MVTFIHQEQDVKSVSLSVIEESIEESLDTLDRAPSLDKDLGYEDSPRTRTQTASVQTSEHVSVIDKSRLREKSIQTTKQEQERASQTMMELPLSKAEENKESEDDRGIDWDDATCDEDATQIQAGFRGMVARERMEAEEREIKKEIAERGQAIEDHLGIDLADPEVIAATTKIQAGFRGYQARMSLKVPMTPSIFISKPTDDISEEGSEYSYIYEDEEDTEDDLESRPDSPKTAVEDYPLTIGGFTATFGIRSVFCVDIKHFNHQRLYAAPG